MGCRSRPGAAGRRGGRRAGRRGHSYALTTIPRATRPATVRRVARRAGSAGSSPSIARQMAGPLSGLDEARNTLILCLPEIGGDRSRDDTMFRRSRAEGACCVPSV